MATVIDTLIVALGLDASKFTAGVSKAAKDEAKLTSNTAKLSKETDKASKAANNHGKELAQMAGQVVKAFNDMRTAAVSMFASYLTASGIEKLIVNLTSADAKLGRMSQNLGIASAEIKAWSNVAEQSGGSAAGMQNDITSLTRSMIDFKQTGNFSPMLSGLASIGVGIQDAQGHAKSATQIMLDLSDRVNGMSRPDASAFLSNHVGFDEGTINTILQGRDALEKQLAAQKENAAAAAANTKKAEELEKATAAAKQKLEAVSNELVGRLIPYLTQLAEWLEQNSGKAAAIAAVVGTVITVFAAWSAGTMVVTGVLALLSAGVTILTTVFSALSAMMGVVMGVLAAFLTPAGAVIAIIAALAAGIIYAYKNYEKLAEVIDRALDWLGFGKNIDGAAWSFTKLKDNILDLARSIWTHVKPVFDWLGGVLGKIWGGDFKGAITMIAQGVSDVVVAAGKEVLSIAADIGNSDAGKAVKQATTNAVGGGVSYSAGTFKNGKMTLSAQDVEDVIKVASTEVVAGLKGKNLKNQAAGVVDTILNRAALAGGNIRKVVNKFGAFSMINSNLRNKSGHKIAYGSVENMPSNAVNRTVRQSVMQHLQERANGKRSIVGGDVNYANPNYLGQASASTKKWVAEVQSQAQKTGQVFGAGKAVHVHGTPSGQKRAPKFDVQLSSYSGYQSQIQSGVQLSRPVVAHNQHNNQRMNTSTSEAHIGTMNVYTQATDAKGVARDINQHLRNQMLVVQANTGMLS